MTQSCRLDALMSRVCQWRTYSTADITQRTSPSNATDAMTAARDVSQARNVGGMGTHWVAFSLSGQVASRQGWKWQWNYSVHKKYGNSNSCVNFNTNASIIHNFNNTANSKYPFLSPYQLSDTFVKYFGSYGHYHDRRLNSKKGHFHSLNWNRHFPLWYGIYTLI